MRGRLQRLGILRAESGHEHFNGSVVFPIFSLRATCSACTAARSRPACAKARRCTRTCRGRTAACGTKRRWRHRRRSSCAKSIIDALTFWCAGFRNVTASYGVNGFTEDHRAAFQKHGVQQVWIAYDRDEAGDAAAERLKEELLRTRHRLASRAVPQGHGRQRIRAEGDAGPQSLAVLLNGASGWETGNSG